MTRDAVVFGIAGVSFGLLVGWIFGSQQAGRPMPAPAPAAQSASQAGRGNQPPPLDVQRANALEQQARARPADAAIRVELGNLYFDAQRFDLAIRWYEEVLTLNPRDVNVSTDLGVAYYYTDDPDRALQQLAASLKVDPAHVKTLLNQGIIRAFGKQDLAGALESWERVVEVAPNSPEAARAKQGIDGLKSAHGAGTGAAGSPAGRGGE